MDILDEFNQFTLTKQEQDFVDSLRKFQTLSDKQVEFLDILRARYGLTDEIPDFYTRKVDEATQRKLFEEADKETQDTIRNWIKSGLITGLRSVVFNAEQQQKGHEILMPARKTLTKKEKYEGYTIKNGKLVKE